MGDSCCSSPCRFRDNRVLALLARVGVGGMFVYLACMKLLSPPDFVHVLGAYDMLPTEPRILIPAIAVIMPWLELTIGIFLLAGILPRGSATLAFVMMVVFTVAVFVRGMSYVSEGTPFMEVAFDCGCGTGVVKLWTKLIENTALICGSLYLCGTGARLWTLLGLGGRGETPA